MNIYHLMEISDNRVVRVLESHITRINAEKARENYLIRTLSPRYLAIIERPLKWSVKDVF